MNPLWTPEDIDTALWLDAADSGTITLYSGAVSQWADKSGEGRHVSQGVASYRGTYDSVNQGVVFDGVNDNYIAGSNYLYAPSSYGGLSLVAVAAPTLEGTTKFLFDFGEHAGGSYGMRFSTDFLTFNTPVSYGGGDTPAVISATGKNLVSCEVIFGSKQEIFLNGAIQGSTPITLSQITATEINEYPSRSTNKGPVCIGAQSKTSLQAARFFGGTIHELVVVRGVPDRQRIEGYLAHKWGIETSLPSEHPYKSSPPVYKTITGIIKDANGDPCARTVRAYDRATGAFLAETTSDSVTGVYELAGVLPLEAQRVVLDNATTGTIYNDLIDRVIPG